MFASNCHFYNLRFNPRNQELIVALIVFVTLIAKYILLAQNKAPKQEDASLPLNPSILAQSSYWCGIHALKTARVCRNLANINLMAQTEGAANRIKVKII